MKTSQLAYTAEVNWKSWLERDLNSHLRDTGPPLYLLCRLIVKFSLHPLKFFNIWRIWIPTELSAVQGSVVTVYSNIVQ